MIQYIRRCTEYKGKPNPGEDIECWARGECGCKVVGSGTHTVLNIKLRHLNFSSQVTVLEKKNACKRLGSKSQWSVAVSSWSWWLIWDDFEDTKFLATHAIARQPRIERHTGETPRKRSRSAFHWTPVLLLTSQEGSSREKKNWRGGTQQPSPHLAGY